MNLVLDDAEEMSIKKKSRKPLGERLLPEHTPGACGSHSEAACAASTVAHHAARRVGREDSAQGGQHYAHDERHAPRGLSPAGAQRTLQPCSPLLRPTSSKKHSRNSVYSESCLSPGEPRGGERGLEFNLVPSLSPAPARRVAANALVTEARLHERRSHSAHSGLPAQTRYGGRADGRQARPGLERCFPSAVLAKGGCNQEQRNCQTPDRNAARCWRFPSVYAER